MIRTDSKLRFPIVYGKILQCFFSLHINCRFDIFISRCYPAREWVGSDVQPIATLLSAFYYFVAVHRYSRITEYVNGYLVAGFI
jgi:hypothetical protein